ncbi:MAG: MmcQ/YjbR family DNA-binding protein [Pseudomonadota bacterium]
MITRADVDAMCAALPGARYSEPPELVSWKVGDKMFACFGDFEGEFGGVSVKTADIETAQMLIDAGEAIKAPYFHRSWVRLDFGSTDRGYAKHRIHVSYDLIRKSLKRAVRDALPERSA